MESVSKDKQQHPSATEGTAGPVRANRCAFCVPACGQGGAGGKRARVQIPERCGVPIRILPQSISDFISTPNLQIKIHINKDQAGMTDEVPPARPPCCAAMPA
jgi:hypothetical protein